MHRPPLKLLWVFPSFKAGALQRRFATLAGALGSDYQHAVCALDQDFGAEAIMGPSVEWRRVTPPPKSKGLFSLGNMWSLRKFLNAEQPNVIVTVNWAGVEWMMVNRGPGSIPHVHIEDELAIGESLQSIDSKKAWTRRRAFSGRNRAFIATSRVIETLFSTSWGADVDAVHYIPAGVETARLAAPARSAEGRLVRLASMGDLVEGCGVDRSIRLIAELRRRGRDVGLVVLGDGPLRPALEAEAERCGVREKVDFVGAQRDVAPYLAQFDIYVSTIETQRTPTSLIEAMASGLPVVAADVGDISEAVASENRLFVQSPNDESALTAAAELMVVDQRLRNRLGALNKERATSFFSLETMVRRYDELFREMSRQSAPLMLPAPTRVAAAKSA